MVDLTPVEEAQIPHGPYGDLPRPIYEVRSQPQVDAAVGRTGWGVGRLPPAINRFRDLRSRCDYIYHYLFRYDWSYEPRIYAD